MFAIRNLSLKLMRSMKAGDSKLRAIIRKE